MTVRSYTTQEQKDIVNSISVPPVDADVLDDFEYNAIPVVRSTSEVTDNVHFQVEQPITNPIMFDIKDDLKLTKDIVNETREEQEQAELKRTNRVFANSEPAEQKAIISVIVGANPDIVFEVLKEYHQMIDKGMIDAGTENNLSEIHSKKYDELLADLKEGKGVVEEHILKYQRFLNY